jgi:hypothetical protein
MTRAPPKGPRHMMIYSEYIVDDLTTVRLLVSRKLLQAVAPTRIKRKIGSNFSNHRLFGFSLKLFNRSL